MANLISVASLLLASALPNALASGYTPPDLCDATKTYEIYRVDLPLRSEFSADATADATGDNSFTYVANYLFSLPGFNQYEALLTGTTSNGSVVLFNQGNGRALDCAKIKTLEFVEVEDCEYRVDYGSKIACDEAIGHWDGYAYIEGEGGATITVEAIQKIGLASTSQFLEAHGSQGIVFSLGSSNVVNNQDGSQNGAGASVGGQVSGNGQVTGSTETTVTDTSSSSKSTIIVNTNQAPKKPKEKKPKEKKPKSNGRGLM